MFYHFNVIGRDGNELMAVYTPSEYRIPITALVRTADVVVSDDCFDCFQTCQTRTSQTLRRRSRRYSRTISPTKMCLCVFATTTNRRKVKNKKNKKHAPTTFRVLLFYCEQHGRRAASTITLVVPTGGTESRLKRTTYFAWFFSSRIHDNFSLLHRRQYSFFSTRAFQRVRVWACGLVCVGKVISRSRHVPAAPQLCHTFMTRANSIALLHDVRET